MNRELWLLRHGKAEQNDGIDDFDRALVKRGKQEAELLGDWLRKNQLQPDIIISSPAKRAIDTTKKLHKIGNKELVPNKDKRLYFEGLESIKTLLAECSVNHKKVLLVGHNPTFENLINYLAGADNLPEVNQLLPTAALAILKMPDDWSNLQEGCAELMPIIRCKNPEGL
jgi:phosphohistidine phosphatase